MKKNLNTKLNLRPLRLKGISFTWQETKMLRKIRENYQGKKRTTALAIYLVMTEFASLAGKGQGKHVNCFKAYLKKISDRCGKSESTVKRYFKEFKILKILSWKNHRAGLMNLSNEWLLLAYNQSPNQFPNKPTSIHNNSPVIKESIRRNSFNNKRDYKNNKDKGFVSIKKIINNSKYQ